jgi:hypothetical protein
MASNVMTSVKLSGGNNVDDFLSFAFIKLIMGPSHDIESVLEEIKSLLKVR